MDEERTEDHSEGWKAFYRQESPRILPYKIPNDPLAYERYQKNKRFNEGWRDAKSEYDSRTKRD